VIIWPEREPVGCYVYRIRTGRYVYVGKGTGRRYRDHIDEATEHALIRKVEPRHGNLKKLNALAKAIRRGRDVRIEIVRDGLTDGQAFALEVEEIAKVPARWRLNIAPGGNGFDSDTTREYALRRMRTLKGRMQHLRAARNGGRRGGRSNVASGHWSRIQGLGGKVGGKIGGRKNVESGHWARIHRLGSSAGGKIGGRKAVESGQLARAREILAAKRKAVSAESTGAVD